MVLCKFLIFFFRYKNTLQSSIAFVDILPDEILSYIFTFLDLEDLSKSRSLAVNHLWHGMLIERVFVRFPRNFHFWFELRDFFGYMSKI